MQVLDDFLAAMGPMLPRYPWLWWLTVVLCRQRSRQGSWRYNFHGRGLLLQGPDGEVVDVDFFHDQMDGSVIDPYFFAWRLETLRAAALPETRLRRWLPSSSTLVAAIGHLRALGVVHRLSSEHVFQLHRWLERHYERVSDVNFVDAEVARAWAEALGDTEYLGLRPDDRPFVKWVAGLCHDRRTADVLPKVVGRMPASDVEHLARHVLQGPIDSATARALEALEAVAAKPSDTAIGLLGRIAPDQHHPYAAYALASYLLCHDEHREEALRLIEDFAGVEVVKGYYGNPFSDKLAVLMLKHDKRRFLLATLWYSADADIREAAVRSMPEPPERSGPVGYTFEELQYEGLRESVEDQRERMRGVLGALRPH